MVHQLKLFLLKPQRVRQARCTCSVQLWERRQVLVLRELRNQPMKACRSFCMSSSYTYPPGYHSKRSGATTQVLTHPVRMVRTTEIGITISPRHMRLPFCHLLQYASLMKGDSCPRFMLQICCPPCAASTLSTLHSSPPKQSVTC